MVAQGVHIRSQGPVVGAVAAVLLVGIFAGQTRGTRHDVVLVLAVYEEEELVFDDRPADARAIGVVLGQRPREGVIVHVFALEVRIVEVGIDAAREFVAARAGHGVDRAARKAALPHVERGHRDRHLLQRVERNGAAARGEVAADAEGIVERRAIDGDVGLPVVAAAHGETVGGGIRLGRQAQDVVHAARHGRHHFDLPAGYVGSHAGPLAVHRASLAFDRYDHGIHTDALLMQRGVRHIGVAQGDFDTRALDALVADHRVSDRVGAARLYIHHAEVAFGVGHRAVLRSRGGVHRYDGRSDERLAVFVEHLAAQPRGGHLRCGGEDGERCQNQEVEFLHIFRFGGFFAVPYRSHTSGLPFPSFPGMPLHWYDAQKYLSLIHISEPTRH